MGVGGKIENPLLKRHGLSNLRTESTKGASLNPTAPSDHLIKSSPSNKYLSNSKPGTTSFGSLHLHNAPSSKTQPTPQVLQSKSKGPSLFNKNLSVQSLTNTFGGKTTASLKTDRNVLPEKGKSSLKGSLYNPKLLMFDKYSTEGTQLNSFFSKTSGVTLLAGPKVSAPEGIAKDKKVKGKKSKSKTKNRDSGIGHDPSVEFPGYDISFAKTLTEQKKEKSLVCLEPSEYLKVERGHFVEENDDDLKMKREKDKIDGKKLDLINLVSIALLQSPDFDNGNDETRKRLMEKVKDMANIDPEFILKLALYARKHLNLRIVTNFLLAVAAYLHETRPFLKKYYNKCIVLPTDWVKVAEFYQTFFDESISSRSVPTALRNVMVSKFLEFDEYQLGKYNKEKPKPTKMIHKADSEDDDTIESEEDSTKSRALEFYTLKKLVRKLHISEPVYAVMCIIGKRYPDDSQSFYQSRLPGVFDETKTGQRMKLAIPETWETQVSLKGNIASTWQDLLDHKRLPFMAMLRNLRNMLIAGISQKHHNLVLKRLTDQNQVVNSQQFPFRFLSAYEVLAELQDMLLTMAYQGNKVIPTKKRSGKPIVIQSNAYDAKLLKRYKDALDTALKISTIYNIPPICGTTLIIIYYDPDFDDAPCTSTKNISKQRSVFEMCLLLGLMCKFHCEDGILIILDIKNDRFMEIENINTDSILENMNVVQQKMKNLSSGERDIMNYLNDELLADQRRIDILLKLGGGSHHRFTDNFMKAYRKDVNPSCLCVTVPLLGDKRETGMTGKFDVTVSGFSDQILRYIAERGNGKQLMCIEKIDVAYGLEDIMVLSKRKPQFIASPSRIERPVMPWKTIRVFISSTFKDMHGERDLLTRYVFPELRCWCYNYCLNLYEVDLRWGITEKQSQSSQTIEICLGEVMKADLFVGILGQRYGWVPDNYQVTDKTDLKWLDSLSPGYSITELEMIGFRRNNPGNDFKSRAMFYFRDEDFPMYNSDIPAKYMNDFCYETEKEECKLDAQKEWIQKSGAEIFKNYPCQWGGVVGGKPIVSGLEQFGQRVLNNLWTAIQVNFLTGESADHNVEPSLKVENDFPSVNMEMAKSFVGGKKLLDKVIRYMVDAKNITGKSLLLLSGKSGCGKSAFMSKIWMMIREQMKTTYSYFFDAADGNQSLVCFVKLLFETLNYAFSGGFSVPEKFSELKLKLEELFTFISKELRGESCVIFIDSLYKVDAGVQASLTDWIPNLIPKGLFFVITSSEDTTCHRMLLSHKQLIENVKIGAMEHADRAAFVRQFMSNYGKSLDESAFNNQMKLLLSKKDSHSPLYLQLACEELRMFGVYENFSQHIKKLAPTILQMIEFSLTRMEVENGQFLIRDTLALLYFSRQGLNKEELFDSLNMLQNFNNVGLDAVTKVGFSCFHDSTYIQQQIPLAYFMKICQAIKLFVSDRVDNSVMQLVYSDIRKIIEKRYIIPGGSEYMSKVHMVLAGIYKRQADPGNNLKWAGNDRKALIELPYHLTASAIAWEDLQALLCSIEFIRAKVEGNLCTQLLEDFQVDVYTTSRQIKMERNKILTHPDVIETKEFIAENVHILMKYPMLLVQQAVNAPDTSYIHQCTESFSNAQLQNVIAWLNKTSTHSTSSMTITQKQPLISVCLSNDESMVACGAADGQLILYEKNTAKELKSFVGHGSSITSCCFVGMDKLCSASDDGSMSIWDIYGGHRLHVLDKHKRQVSCCTSTADGKLILSASLDNTAKLWNTHDGSVAGNLYSGIIHPFNCVALDINEKHAAVGSWNGQIIIWNILENIKTATYKGHRSSVRALAYAPSGRHLASASLAGEILLWSTENGTMVGQLSAKSHPTTSLCYSPSGLQLITASTKAKIKVWSGSLGAPGSVYSPDNIESNKDAALCVTVGKSFIAAGYNSGKVVLYNEKNKILNEWKAHSSSVRSLSFINQDTSRPSTNKEKQLITASDDCLVKRWSITAKVKSVCTMKGHTRPVKCARSKEAYIISGSEDCTLHVWPGLIFAKDNDDNVKPSAVLRGHTGTVTCCDISPCETMAMSGSTDKSLIIWSLNNKNALCTVNLAHADGLTACSWSDVGNFIVTGSNDFILKLWDAKFLIANSKNNDKLKEKLKFVGHTATINDVKYKYGCITSACTDGSVKVWSHKGVEITTFSPHEKRINGCDIWTPSLDNELFGSNWSDVVAEKGIQQKVKATKRAAMNDVLVYTASDDGLVSSFYPFKPFLVNELYGHTDVVSDILVSKKHSDVISCSLDKTIKTWEKRLLSDVTLPSTHSGEVSCIAILEDGAMAVSCGYDGNVCVYRIFGFSKRFSCSKFSLKAVGIISSKYIVTGDNVGDVCVWDVEDEKMVATVSMDSSIQSIAVGGADNVYIAVSSFSQFQIFKWVSSSLSLVVESLKPTSEQLYSFHISEKSKYVFEYPMSSMVFLENSNVLLSTDNYEQFHTMDVKKKSNQGVRTIPRIEYNRNSKSKQTQMDSAASCIAYGVDESRVLVFIGNTNGTISFNQLDRSTNESEIASSKKFHDDYVTGILCENANHILVTASKDCTVKVWKYEGSVDPFQNIHQMGLFHCRSPVTKLVGVRSNSSLKLMVGDVNGNVDFLSVQI